MKIQGFSYYVGNVHVEVAVEHSMAVPSFHADKIEKFNLYSFDCCDPLILCSSLFDCKKEKNLNFIYNKFHHKCHVIVNSI